VPLEQGARAQLRLGARGGAKPVASS
jgi:hypothetical protein